MRFPAATHILCPFPPPKRPFHSHRMRSKAQKRILCPTAHHHPQNSQPKKAATGLRSSSPAASPRRWAQKGARGRSDGLAAGKSPGEPAEQAAEGRQRQERRARGREKPGRARGDGHRRAPDEGATGSRRENAGASPRGRPQKGTRRRSDGLAAGKSPGEPAEMGTEGHQRHERRARK